MTTVATIFVFIAILIAMATLVFAIRKNQVPDVRLDGNGEIEVLSATAAA